MNWLLKGLLRWFIFAGTTFFASGAVIDAGIDTTGAQDAAGNESSAGSDSGTDETGASPDAQADADANADASSSQQDGRTLPKDVQTALKSLKEAHPEFSKALDELRKGYFSARQHSEFFKSPAEARQAKATLDLVGGAEGISSLQSQIAAIEQVDSSFEQGNPQVIDDVATDYPEGFKKLVPYSLDKLQKLDANAYNTTLQPHVYAAMESAGLGTVLQELSRAIATNDTASIKSWVEKTAQWYEGQKQQAGSRPKQDDPERQKFETERKQFEEQKEQSFRKEIGSHTYQNQQSEITKALTPYLKTRTLSAEAKTDLNDGINAEINRILKADSNYQAQVKAMLASRSRDPQKIEQYINAAVSEAAPKAVKAVWTRRYGSVAAAKPVTPQNQKSPVNPASSAPVKLTAKPNRDDVDWSKTKDIMFIASKAIMKNGPYKGRMVTW